MHWIYLIPAGPKLIWRAFKIRQSNLHADKRIRKANRSFLLAFVPFCFGFMALLIWVISQSDVTWDSYWSEVGSEWSEVEWTGGDTRTIAMATILGYWTISIMARAGLAFRAASTEVAARMIFDGINPAETSPKPIKKRSNA